MIARVLLVDDNDEVRTLLKEHLERQRLEVIEATDGAQAFAIAEKETPHLIITDIVMPGLYGTTSAKLLQAYWRTAEVPIILISGSIEAGLVSELLKHPKVRYLRKPIDLPQLDTLMRQLLPNGGYRPWGPGVTH